MNRFARQRSLKTALALALAFASGTAAALGLGQIELKSKLGEPLLAEIPIVSNDPAELEQLRASLASPETFARVGLTPPDGIVANLQFTSALDAAGNPVIRVTSVQPIEQPLLTFLIEVDWGQGRLVREYSTLLDAPRTVSAPLQPPIDAPVMAPSNTIVRAPEAMPAPEPSAEPASDDEPLVTAPLPDNAIPATVPPPPAAVSPSPPAFVERPSEYGAVERGETLSGIAARLDLGVSLDQAMIALLRANPDAFINDNINLLKQGAVLRVPDRTQVADIGAAQASALVRTQVQQWREAQRPVPQPAIANASAANMPANDIASNTESSAPAATGARLQIVPPGASRATRAGTQSGITAGGEGEMLRQELQQTKETLAARDAELAEMQSRIADLEKLQSDQQQLLSMKDTELAAAQQRLASSQQAAPATPPPADAARSSSLPWVFGGVALLLLALLGGWFMRRRAATPRFRAPPPTSLADAFAPGLVPVPAAPAPEALKAAPAAVASETGNGSDLVQPEEGATAAPLAAAEDGPLPFWDRRERTPRPSGRPLVTEFTDAAPAAMKAPAPAPAWHDASSKSKLATPALVSAATSGVEIPVQQRLELARAYLDLGDHDSARQLLGELVAHGDPDDRLRATRMLRELE